LKKGAGSFVGVLWKWTVLIQILIKGQSTRRLVEEESVQVEREVENPN